MRKLACIMVAGVSLWAETAVQFAPPPPVFLGSYNTEKPQGKAGFSILSYSAEGISMGGFGFDGAMQQAVSENVWLGFGIGIFMLSGQDDAQTYDMTMTSMPMSGVVGLRLPVDDQLELGFIIGPVLGLTAATVSTPYADAYIDMSSFGMQAGAIAYMGMGNGMGFTPYFLTQQQSGEATTTAGSYQTTATYEFSSQTVGFDITFNNYSFGAMLQSLKRDEEASDLTLLRFAAEF